MKKPSPGSMTAALAWLVVVISLATQPEVRAQRQNDANAKGTNIGLYRNQPMPPSGPVVKLPDGTIDLSGVWLGGVRVMPTSPRL